jgi:hypothetical protein
MEEKSTKKLSYEELERVAVQLQQRVVNAENKLRSIDYTSIRLNWLFEVLKKKNLFEESFVTKCTKDIQDLLTFDDDTEKTNQE